MFFRIHKHERMTYKSPHYQQTARENQKKVELKNQKNTGRVSECQLKFIKKKIQDKYVKSKITNFKYQNQEFNDGSSQSSTENQIWSKLKDMDRVQLKKYHQQEQISKIIRHSNKKKNIGRLSSHQSHLNHNSTQNQLAKSQSPHHKSYHIPILLRSNVELTKDFQTLNQETKINGLYQEKKTNALYQETKTNALYQSKMQQIYKKNKANVHRTLTVETEIPYVITPSKRKNGCKINPFLKNNQGTIDQLVKKLTISVIKIALIEYNYYQFFCKAHNMSSKNKFALDSQNIDHQVTPRKNPRYQEFKKSSPERIKSRLTIIKRPEKKNHVIFVFLLLILTLFIIYTSYQSRSTQLILQASAQKQQCQKDYQKNKCTQPIKGLIEYCQSKKRCMEIEVEVVVNSRIEISQLLGKNIGDFCQAAGAITMIGWIIMFWVWTRNPIMNIHQVYEQFYQ